MNQSILFLGMIALSVLSLSSAYTKYLDYETQGQFPDSSKDSSWSSDEDSIYSKSSSRNTESLPGSDSFVQQLFGDKQTDSAAKPMDGQENSLKEKRESHSLSIVNPLDVLRQRLMLEMARRRMKENQEQIRENAVILKNLGKRSIYRKQDNFRRIPVSNSEDLEI